MVALAVRVLTGAGPAGAEPAEPIAVAAVPAAAEEAEAAALLARLWQVTGLAPARPVSLAVVSGLGANAAAAPGAIAISREYLRWAAGFAAPERARILARTLAHELAHLALGHRGRTSPADELAAEALGIDYFERAGFDCRWWVAYVRTADETAGRQGWPALEDVIEHDTEACARVRALR